MANISWMTAGESHGKAIIGIIEGVPANLEINDKRIQLELRRRQKGYGRGIRMQIETDQAEFISGIRFGKTIGSPIAVSITNRDWQNWQQEMALLEKPADLRPPVTVPRPGHADLAGSIKYQQQDLRNILERASARETAARVALGAIAKQLLAHFKIGIVSQVIQIKQAQSTKRLSTIDPAYVDDYVQTIEDSPLHCGDIDAARQMMHFIDEAKDNGDSVGGRFELMAFNVPIGLGSHIQWNRRLDGVIAQALMSIPAIKAVEIGAGIDCAAASGSMIHDEIFWDANANKFYRQTNHAGGIEGGMSNGDIKNERLK